MRIVDLHHYRGPYIYVGGMIPCHKSIGLIGCEPFLDSFREWLFVKIKEGGKRIMTLMDAIDENTSLGCWCCDKQDASIFDDPEVCHAQIIWKAWRYLKQEKVNV